MLTLLQPPLLWWRQGEFNFSSNFKWREDSKIINNHLLVQVVISGVIEIVSCIVSPNLFWGKSRGDLYIVFQKHSNGGGKIKNNHFILQTALSGVVETCKLHSLSYVCLLLCYCFLFVFLCQFYIIFDIIMASCFINL